MFRIRAAARIITRRAVRMGCTFLLVLLVFRINIQAVKLRSACSVEGYVATCVNGGLQRLPELPTHVTYLDVSLNNIAELNETSFSHLEDLKILIMQQQSPGLVIRNNTFKRLSNLILLQLDYNHMLQMETDAFAGLHHLKVLTLTQCSLNDSILSGDILRPLVSLEKLFLRDNNIARIHPAPFFSNMKRFHVLDVSQTTINSICEEDLKSFQGKHFTQLSLSSVKLRDMTSFWSGWETCGNPLKNMSITVLDLSSNGFEVNMAKRFFDAITGTKIQTFILSNSYSMGSDFFHKNLQNPDKFTFKGLGESGMTHFDLSNSKIFTLSNSVFGSLSDVQHITLAHSLINKIENDAFLGLTNLLKLNLSNNYLHIIDLNTFQNLKTLQVLDLSYNSIWVIGHQTFQELPNLLNLNLTGNKIESVHKFATLPSLKKLYLGENIMTSLYNLPNVARNLTTLDLEFNRLTALSDLYTILREFSNIEIIYLKGNTFWSCEKERQTVVSRVQLLNLELSTIGVIWSEGKCLDIFNHLHQLMYLSLRSNWLQSLPENIFQDLTSLIFLDLSFNSLKYLPKGIFPKSLQMLNLNSNSLYSLDPNLFSTLTHLDLLHNQFRCDCSLRGFQTWLKQTNATPTEDVICASPEDHYMLPVSRASIQCKDEEEEKRAEKLRFVLFICFTALIILFTTCTVIYVRHRGYVFKLYKSLTVRLVDGKREEAKPDEVLYDVYLCFSSRDMKWVEKALLKRLDSEFSEQNVLNCCFEERDFIPGKDHLSNIRHAIQSSRKTLCVVSERFLQDGWCLETFTQAHCRMLTELKDALLVLVVGNIPQYRLLKYEQVRSYIETKKTYFVWPEDSQDLEWFFEQLIHKIRKNTEVKQTAKPNTNVQADTAV